MTRKAWTGRLRSEAPQPDHLPANFSPKEAPRPRLPPYTLGYQDAAAYVGISLHSLRRAIARGELAPVRIGGRLMVRRIDLEAMVDVQADDGYSFKPPQTVRECRAASAQAERYANELTAHAKRTQAPEVADFLFLAARAYTQLAVFFRWNGGIGEFHPDERISA